jgi:hypothetical protein
VFACKVNRNATLCCFTVVPLYFSNGVVQQLSRQLSHSSRTQYYKSQIMIEIILNIKVMVVFRLLFISPTFFDILLDFFVWIVKIRNFKYWNSLTAMWRSHSWQHGNMEGWNCFVVKMLRDGCRSILWLEGAVFYHQELGCKPYNLLFTDINTMGHEDWKFAVEE